MSVYREMGALADAWRREALSRVRTYDAGMRAIAEGQASFWRRMMSGTIGARQLARMGHPYGRGSSAEQRREGAATMRGAPPSVAMRAIGRRMVPKLPINVQSGWLRRSVAVSRHEHDGWRVGASTPYARFILHPLGTRRMVGRGLVTGRLLGGSPSALGATEIYFRRQLRELRRRLTGR